MNSQQEQDQYILVPRSRVLAPNSESKTLSQSSASIGSTASGPSQTNASDLKESKVSAISSTEVKAVKNVSLSVLSKGMGTFRGDHQISTTMSYYLDYTIPNGALNYSLTVFPDLCSEWPSFAQLFEQYKITMVECQTWTGNLMFYGSGSVQMWPIASLITRTPASTTMSMAQLCDHPETQLLDYGYNKNLHVQTLEPSGAFVSDPVTGWQHTPGWLSTSAGGTHAWASIYQQTTGALVGTLGASRPLTHRLRIAVVFRRRREVS